MGRKIEISLEKIISRIGGFEFVDNDFEYIFNNMEKAQEFLDLCIESKSSNDLNKIKKYLIQNENYVKKENLILILAKNCRYKIAELNERLRQEETKNVDGQQQLIRSISTIKQFKEQIKMQEKRLKEIIKIGRGIEAVLPLYCSDGQNKYYIDVVDSREFIDEKNINHSKNRKRLEDIDRTLKDMDDGGKLSLKYLLEIIEFEGVRDIFISEEFGNKVIRMVIENRMLQLGKLSVKEFEYIRDRDPDKYKKMLKEIDSENFADDILKAVIENARYIDVDQLLLKSLAKFQSVLEKDIFSNDGAQSVGFMIESILDKVEDKNIRVESVLGVYSVKDVKDCLKRFTNNGYLSKNKIEELKNKIIKGEMNLSDIDSEYIDILFSDEELEQISSLNVENLEYLLEQISLENEDTISLIIEGYEEGSVSLDKISKMKFLYNLSEGISIEKLNEYWTLANKDNAKKEDIEKYKKYLELYKEILIKDKTKEKLEENSNSIIENLINYYNEKDKDLYIKYIEDYYKKGLLTLDSIVDWNGQEVITRLYNDKIITIDDIVRIMAKVGIDYIEELYIQLVNSDEISYDERIKYIESGFVGEEEVIKLYKKGIIIDEDLLELSKKAIIIEETAKEIIESRNLEERIKSARAKATGWSEYNKIFDINGLEKKQNENIKYMIGTGGTEKEKSIIDPNLRQRYIEMLGLYRINVDCEEDSPFYHYEFYSTPDETGEIGANSVIIAERYYNNKNTERTYATNNATYFFKYKDFLVLTNLGKKDMLEERENIVFRANHTITTNTKQGTWAKNVLENVMKAILGNELKGLSEKTKRQKIIEQMRQMYLKEEIDEIFDLCDSIDSGEGILIMEKKKRRNSPNFDDDDEGLR